MLFNLVSLVSLAFASPVTVASSASKLPNVNFSAHDIKGVTMYVHPVATNSFTAASTPAIAAQVHVCPNFNRDCCVKNPDGSSDCTHPSLCSGAQSFFSWTPFICVAENLSTCLSSATGKAALSCVSSEGIQHLDAMCIVEIIASGVESAVCLWTHCK